MRIMTAANSGGIYFLPRTILVLIYHLLRLHGNPTDRETLPLLLLPLPTTVSKETEAQRWHVHCQASQPVLGQAKSGTLTVWLEDVVFKFYTQGCATGHRLKI